MFFIPLVPVFHNLHWSRPSEPGYLVMSLRIQKPETKHETRCTASPHD
jgi:hypothetical protein